MGAMRMDWYVVRNVVSSDWFPLVDVQRRTIFRDVLVIVSGVSYHVILGINCFFTKLNV